MFTKLLIHLILCRLTLLHINFIFLYIGVGGGALLLLDKLTVVKTKDEMKIVFLDIDGVLNSDIWYKNQKGSNKTDNSLKYHLDSHAISLLNKILNRTQAKIVLSSTWRLKHSLVEIQKTFEENGFNGEIISVTPDLVSLDDSFVRGNEILKWCKENEDVIGERYFDYRKYAIIDDKSDMLYWQRNNFFQTDRYCGLTPSKASEVIKLLKQ